ncbi:MAG: hypothetical protein DRP85_04215, partial [Candidatus Makaraimicrobium thalassicum]
MPCTLKSLDKPSIDSLTLLEGGDLEPNTTYYYRICSVSKDWRSPDCIYSPWSDIVSITTTATHRTVRVDWTPVSGEYKAIVLRSLDGNDWTVKDKKAIGPYYRILRRPPFEDDGTESMSRLWYRPEGVRVLYFWGDIRNNNDSMAWLYEQDKLNGWNLIKKIEAPNDVEWAPDWSGVSPPRKTFGNTYVIDGSVVVGENPDGATTDTYFSQYNATIWILGGLSFDETYNKLFQLGNPYGPRDGCQLLLASNSDLVLKGVVRFYASLIMDAGRTRMVGYTTYEAGFNWIRFFSEAVSGSEFKHNRFANFWYVHNKDPDAVWANNSYERMDAAWRGDGLLYENLLAYACTEGPSMHDCDGSNTFRRCVTTPTCGYDLRWGSTGKYEGRPQYLDDCTWGKANPNNPRDPKGIWYGYRYIKDGGMLVFRTYGRLCVRDSNNEPIVGAHVCVIDSTGKMVYDEETDAEGCTTAKWVPWWIITPNPVYRYYLGTRYLSEAIALGHYFEDNRLPFTITVSKPGYETVTVKRDALSEIINLQPLEVYPTITSIDITGDKDNLQIGQTYPVQVIVDATGCDKTYYVRCYATCPRGLGVQGFPSDWVQIAPGETHTFEGTITPAEAGGIDNLAFRIYAAEEIPDELPQIADQMEIDITVAIPSPLTGEPVIFTTQVNSSNFSTDNSPAVFTNILQK